MMALKRVFSFVVRLTHPLAGCKKQGGNMEKQQPPSMPYTRSSLGIGMTCMVNSSALAINNKDRNFGDRGYNEQHAKIIKEEALKCASSSFSASINGSNSDSIPVNDYGGTLQWESKVQNLIYTGSMWGALLSTLPLGYCADKLVSPIILLQCAAGLIAFSSLAFSFVAQHLGPFGAFGARFLIGVGEGAVLPSVNLIIAQWIPNREKSSAATLFTVGAQLAGVAGVPVSAFFCSSSLRWPAIFYISGSLLFVWILLLRFTVTTKPSQARWMSERERQYLDYYVAATRPLIDDGRRNFKIPFRAMLTSPQLIACLLVVYAFNIQMTLLYTYMPTFLKEVMFLSMINNGYFSTASHIGQMISKLAWSIGIDNLKARNVVSNTVGCRISQATACLLACVALLAVSYFASCTRPYLVIALFFMLGIGNGPATSGFYTSIIILAPAFTGVISSMMMIVAYCGMLSTPALVSYFRVYGTSDEWARIFLTISVLVFISGIFYVVLPRIGEAQTWGQPTMTSNEDAKTVEESERVLGKPTIDTGTPVAVAPIASNNVTTPKPLQSGCADITTSLTSLVEKR